MYNQGTTLVRTSDGRVRTADLGHVRGDGTRAASVRVTRGGAQYRISGRITTRHGYNRVLSFTPNRSGINAKLAA